MSSDYQQDILRLRDRKLSPKQIARQLGLRPSEVSAILQAQAEQVTQERTERGDLQPLRHCLINEGAAQVLLDSPRSEKFSRSEATDDLTGNGLAQIFVTRLDRNVLLVGSYLIDYWCLGVKNCFGPRKFDQRKYDHLVQQSYAGFEQDAREISLEQAQNIIWGSVAYAAGLGFSPHPDFETAKTHLGTSSQMDQSIVFGRDGKPFYVSGPRDQPTRIIATLREHAGDGNFDYLIQA
ncbi:hypothetical protein ACQ4M3_42105 [Leptolyngbya sp. AN03gr2]|uniref:hypothetical protein n=1 Tax=unclassified Leptolyngbya TaxID=2650499 RepID=UPI003D31A985